MKHRTDCEGMQLRIIISPLQTSSDYYEIAVVVCKSLCAFPEHFYDSRQEIGRPLVVLAHTPLFVNLLLSGASFWPAPRPHFEERQAARPQGPETNSNVFQLSLERGNDVEHRHARDHIGPFRSLHSQLDFLVVLTGPAEGIRDEHRRFALEVVLDPLLVRSERPPADVHYQASAIGEHIDDVRECRYPLCIVRDGRVRQRAVFAAVNDGRRVLRLDAVGCFRGDCLGRRRLEPGAGPRSARSAVGVGQHE
mmetsp:Transcript_27243/g.66278  ORF Transcript_27243/g.66278 Transcript_27243/m.66278 type:complete len:251 (+) Transcript_27243:229-981(+)